MNRLYAQWRSAVMSTVMILFLALFGAALRPKPEPQLAQRDPMVLVVSPNDPLMTEAIRYAKAGRQNEGPWGGASRKQGATATFDIPGGTITLTQSEIKDANFIYPQLVSSARRPDYRRPSAHSSDAGFDSDFNDHSQWGN